MILIPIIFFVIVLAVLVVLAVSKAFNEKEAEQQKSQGPRSDDPFGSFGSSGDKTVAQKSTPKPSYAPRQSLNYEMKPQITGTLEGSPIDNYRLLGKEGAITEIESDVSSSILKITKELTEERGLDGFAALLVMGEILEKPKSKR